MHLKQINLDRILNKETANTGKKTTPMNLFQIKKIKLIHCFLPMILNLITK